VSATRTVVYAALAGNLLVALTKGAAAAWTGSSSMLSEAVHSMVDTGNQVLLLYGMRRARKQPSTEHPIGHGRELYFWSFVVALLIFALGAGVSLYEGVVHMRHPEPVKDAYVNYIVLALAFLFEGGSWGMALRKFHSSKGQLGYFEAFRRSKDPPSFMVLFEDSAALVGIVLAAAGTYASAELGLPLLDGVASIAIGVLLAVVAVLLARESKSLLIGERADRVLSDSILKVAGEQPLVARANGLITVQLAPDQVLVALSLEFADDMRAPAIERAVADIEQRVRAAHPEVVALFVKPQTEKTYRQRLSELEAGEAD
jgi:cation diffusion facilitator family transporter